MDVAWDGNPGIAVALPNAHGVAVIRNLNAGFARLIEYSRTRSDGSTQYFITPIKAEIDALDSGQFAGWARTGGTFRAYERAAPGRNAVCRFFSPTLESHFYTPYPDECDAVANQFAATWGVPESRALFHAPISIAGSCAAGFTPVYRLYNPDSVNHRHTTNKSVRDSMVAAGWVSEGQGNDGVVICAP